MLILMHEYPVFGFVTWLWLLGLSVQLTRVTFRLRRVIWTLEDAKKADEAE
jgi:hypothetical protein